MYPSPQRNEADVVFEGASKYARYALEDPKSKFMYLTIKRGMDFLLALFGLVLLSPLFLIISVLIKLEDPKGSVFFYQTRIGKNERPFRMYKFRSMVSNAEELLDKLLEQNEISGAMFKMKEDPRVTKLGKFIRKTSIDELPQLWNVVRGEMSLVGPRPALPREVMQYSRYDKLRLKVSPGCTGLWQVSGRNNLSFQEMLALDLEYIERRGIWLDVKVMFRTVKIMIFPNSAY
ncbi:sugar transferase [Paenibacillus lautus]|uniref:Sugar transferase n=1 Tax=Paenibacillus lautus TaxID=1401 RepID=A0A385TT86_PAELA|nr:sugar transferase [Paenibacillus lautus]AYB46926.1 sugar transferase [Paenibacillus lautus]VTR27448.1 undecaprenyl-phosphate galactose phosphotransferase [Actinobacillus pleuropneumoniae]